MQAYGRVAQILHWVSAILLLSILVFAFGLSDVPDTEKSAEYASHSLAASSLLAVMVIRLGWRLTHPAPAFPDTMPKPRQRLARAVHTILYVLIFAQIGVGLLLSSTVSVDVQSYLIGVNYTRFGLISDRHFDVLQFLHTSIYWVLISMIALHIAAATQHVFFGKKEGHS